MARPLKAGVDYFPIHVYAWQDDKIQYLFSKIDPKSAWTVITGLWFLVYRVGPVARFGKCERSAFAHQMESMGVDAETLNTVLDLAQETDLIHLIERDGTIYLTSRGIQKQYLEIIRAMKRRSVGCPDALIYPDLLDRYFGNIPEKSGKNPTHTLTPKNKTKGKERKVKNSGKNPENSGRNPPHTPEPCFKKDLESANAQLGQVAKHYNESDPAFLRDNRYVSAGRRPLKKYPLIWIAPPKLERAIEQIIEAGIEPEDLPKVFERVSERLEQWRDDGKALHRVNAYAWLIGWALRDTAEHQKSLNDMNRSKLYLEKATR